MAHDISPNTKYSVVSLRIAVEETNPESIFGALNEWLTASIGDDFLADYELHTSDEPVVVESSDDPEEGDLFENSFEFSVCIEDPNYQESWYRIHTTSNLSEMDDDTLRKKLSEHIVITDEDRFFVSELNALIPININ